MTTDEQQQPVQTEAPRPWIARAVERQTAPPVEGEPKTKKDRRIARERAAVRRLMERGASENAALLLARERFRKIEEEGARVGRPEAWPYVQSIADAVLRLIEQAIPLADYAEYPGAPERPGAATQSGIPSWVFRRWCEGRAELRVAVARARDAAADAIADRHLHLAEVALREPDLADAVRVAGEILKWQAIVRAPKRYNPQPDSKPMGGNVNILIQTQPSPRVIEAEVLQPSAQVPELTGPMPG